MRTRKNVFGVADFSVLNLNEKKLQEVLTEDNQSLRSVVVCICKRNFCLKTFIQFTFFLLPLNVIYQKVSEPSGRIFSHKCKIKKTTTHIYY